MAIRAISRHSPSGITAPVGLLGSLTRIARHAGVIAASISAGRGRKPSSDRVGTATGFAPHTPSVS